MSKFELDRRKILMATGAALTAGLAGCGGGGDNGNDSGNGNGNGGSPEGTLDSYLSENDANGYDGTDSIVDETGSDSVTVTVGAGNNGLAFEPAALRVSTGTTVTWEWTGEGGAHNVVSSEGPTDLDSGSPVMEEGTTYEETLSSTGVERYYCNPHRGQGMHGAIIVSEGGGNGGNGGGNNSSE